MIDVCGIVEGETPLDDCVELDFVMVTEKDGTKDNIGVCLCEDNAVLDD